MLHIFDIISKHAKPSKTLIIFMTGAEAKCHSDNLYTHVLIGVIKYSLHNIDLNLL